MHLQSLLLLLPLLASSIASAATFHLKPAPERCGVPAASSPPAPAAAAARIPDSQPVSGVRNIAWAWLGIPTNRYPHDALGSAVHAASLHAIVVQPDGSQRTLSLDLPPNRVFEDRVLRLADLDGDGRDEIILVESDALLGSSLVVYGLRLGAAARQPVLAQMARSPFIGTPNRWLNPVGVADFDGDGRPDIAAVITPHIGGVLTLYRYEPPVLEPAAQMPGLANHRIGSIEQQLAVIVPMPGQHPAVILPGTGLRSLRVLGLADTGTWRDLVAPVSLTAQVQRITPLPGGACVLLASGLTLEARLRD